MENYNCIIGAYASIFELSVALNFAYAASKPFRETIKSGFLQSIKQMDAWYSSKQHEIMDKIALMSDSDLDGNAKNIIKEKLETMLSHLKDEDKKLKDETEEAQLKIANQIKPIYIYTAIFSLFILFLGGQEVSHHKFPHDAFNTIVYVSTVVIPVLYISSFLDYAVPVPIAISIVLLASISGLFLPVSYMIPMTNKHLLDAALFISFLPFILSVSRLVWLNSWLEIKHRWNYFKAYREVKNIELHADQIRESRDYFRL